MSILFSKLSIVSDGTCTAQYSTCWGMINNPVFKMPDLKCRAWQEMISQSMLTIKDRYRAGNEVERNRKKGFILNDVKIQLRTRKLPLCTRVILEVENRCHANPISGQESCSERDSPEHDL